MSEYVHCYTGRGGQPRWLVAEYKDGRYYAPQRKDMVRLTGANTVFGRIEYVAATAYTYSRRSAAERKAQELYGEKPIRAAQMIRQYREPEWLVQPVGDPADRSELAALNEAEYAVIDRHIQGWGDYDCIIRVETVAGYVDYLARLA